MIELTSMLRTREISITGSRTRVSRSAGLWKPKPQIKTDPVTHTNIHTHTLQIWSGHCRSLIYVCMCLWDSPSEEPRLKCRCPRTRWPVSSSPYGSAPPAGPSPHPGSCCRDTGRNEQKTAFSAFILLEQWLDWLLAEIRQKKALKKAY